MAVAGMARFGISPKNTYGVSIPNLRKIAKEVGTDHGLALELWESGIHEARILAGMVDDPEKVTEKQMERWVNDFDSWDVCDQVYSNLFDKTEFAYQKAVEWTERDEEFVETENFWFGNQSPVPVPFPWLLLIRRSIEKSSFKQIKTGTEGTTSRPLRSR